MLYIHNCVAMALSKTKLKFLIILYFQGCNRVFYGEPENTRKTPTTLGLLNSCTDTNLNKTVWNETRKPEIRKLSENQASILLFVCLFFKLWAFRPLGKVTEKHQDQIVLQNAWRLTMVKCHLGKTHIGQAMVAFGGLGKIQAALKSYIPVFWTTVFPPFYL